MLTYDAIPSEVSWNAALFNCLKIPFFLIKGSSCSEHSDIRKLITESKIPSGRNLSDSVLTERKDREPSPSSSRLKHLTFRVFREREKQSLRNAFGRSILTFSRQGESKLRVRDYEEQDWNLKRKRSLSLGRQTSKNQQ